MCEPEDLTSCPLEKLVPYTLPHHPPEVRDLAVRRLNEFFLRTARRVLRRRGRVSADDAEDLVQYAWTRLDPRRPPPSLGGWCFTVMRNSRIDESRREKVSARYKEDLRRQLAEESRHLPAGLSSGTEALLSAVLESLRRIRPSRRRIVLLCLLGAWRLVPEGDWEQWLEETGIEPPFPPSGFDLQTLSGRITTLQEGLGVSRQVIHQDRRRALECLHNLDWDGRLRDGQ